MAEKPTKGKPAKKGPPPSGGGAGGQADGVQWTTFRIYAQDGDELGDLAKEEGEIIAETYRKYLAPLVKQRLIERTREKLKKLEGK